MRFLKQTFLTSSILAASIFSVHAHSHQPILVTNANDAGKGSLRAALMMAAKDDHASQIMIVTKEDIKITSTLKYGGKSDVEILGNQQSVVSKADLTLFEASEGANISISSLSFKGAGDWSINKQAKNHSKAIFVKVPQNKTGTVTLSLNQLTVSGVAAHGVHISDCSLAEKCGSGGGGAGEGSDASIAVSLNNVRIENVGNGQFDADGLRVDERGKGSIYFYANDAMFSQVGADGVELDEGQDGDVEIKTQNTQYVANGAYCDPKILKAFMPKQDEGEFKQGEKQKADIPAEIKGSPDDRCFEREVDLYKDGSVEAYEFGIDLDDGFDVDEAGNGSVKVYMNDTLVENNLDEGLDFDEAGAGGFEIAMMRAVSKGNTDDGIKISEEDDGGIFGSATHVAVSDNGGTGAVFEEEQKGDLDLTLLDLKSANNKKGKRSLELIQKDEGHGHVKLVNVNLEEKIKDKGVEIIK